MNEDRDRLLRLCVVGMNRKGLDSQQYKDRLMREVKEIDALDGHEFILEMRDRLTAEGKIYAENQNNLLVYELLNISVPADMERPPVFEEGEYPDIDIDYLGPIRDYLKHDWAPRIFGRERVCSIGNYTTFGLKSAFIDMAKVFGCDRDEILSLTTKLGLKDEDGKALTYDKALQEYPELKAYCDRNPDVADAVKKCLHRNRGMGVHAGGLIVSSKRIDNLVPLVRGKEDAPVSAWVEGLHGQDLGPMGLIKFDLLVITNLLQIGLCCKLVKQRHQINYICSDPAVQRDWSDTSYLDDKLAIELANAGDLLGIFQFDSPGIRKLAKGNVTCFDDLMAYSAIYRPGPLGMGMHDRYIARKNGKETYELHPILQPILGSTYGVMIYQEQVMQILNAVGEIPLKDCEAVRKAISKKKIEKFAKYKDMFLRNGQRTLGASIEELESLWSQIESFAEYGFNKSMDISTYIDGPYGGKMIGDFLPGDVVYGIDEDGNTIETEVVAVHDHGELEGYEITFDDGYQVTTSIDHKFLTEGGQISLREICRTNSLILSDSNYKKNTYGKCKEQWMDGKVWRIVSHEDRSDGSSKVMLVLSGEGMEDQNFGRISGTSVSVRADVSNVSASRGPSSFLPRVRGNKAGEYSGQDGEVEHRQSFSREEGDFLRDRQEDIGKTGNTRGESRAAKEVAEREPGKTRGMHRSRPKKFEAVSNGVVVEGQIGMEFSQNYNRERRTSECGFRRREGLDRSRWILPFFRDQESTQTPFFPSDEGRDVEQGGSSSQGCDVASDRHDLLREFFGRDEARMVEVDPDHAPIADTGRLVPRRIVRVMPVGKRRMYDLEVASATHNFLLPNGVVTSNSHSCAYTYISSRLLYLKAHYPIEFYTATLQCEKTTEKIKEYMIDARRRGIEIERVDINKSEENFCINAKDNGTGESIYYGFAKLKGLGEDVALRIVANQRYGSFEEFLEQFGTDAKVLTALISLGAFGYGNRIDLFKFYEHYKDWVKKIADRNKRHDQTKERHHQKLYEALHELYPKGADFQTGFSDDHFNQYEIDLGVADFNAVDKLRVAYFKCIETHAKKREADQRPNFSEFIADAFNLDEKWETMLSQPMEVAENAYYGFRWTHPLERSPDYRESERRTFHLHRQAVDEGNRTSYVEVEIEKVEQKPTKKGGVYYLLTVSDAMGEVNRLNVWEDDFSRFDDMLIEGNLVKLMLVAPDAGFPTYKLHSPPRHLRHKLPTKNMDFRVIVYRKSEDAE